jgi:hypothetical protein
MRVSTSLAREDENVNCQALELLYETFKSHIESFMFHAMWRSRAEPFITLIIRQQQDLSKKLQECQALLGEVEPLVSGNTAKRIQDVLVSMLVPNAHS